MKGIIDYFLIILLPIVIIMGNFLILTESQSYQRHLLETSGVYGSLGQVTTDTSYENIFNYIKRGQEIDENMFSRQAIRHMADVKHLLDFTKSFFFIVTFVALVAAAFLVVTRKFKILAKSIFMSSVATFSFVTALALGLLTSFDFFFDKFHRIVFTDELWLFGQDDFLIKLFPEQFFSSFANQLAINILLTSAILASVTYKLRKK